MDVLGILLAASHNDGFVVLTAEPLELLATGLLTPVSDAFGPPHGFKLTEKGRSTIRRSLKARKERDRPFCDAGKDVDGI